MKTIGKSGRKRIQKLPPVCLFIETESVERHLFGKHRAELPIGKFNVDIVPLIGALRTRFEHGRKFFEPRGLPVAVDDFSPKTDAKGRNFKFEIARSVAVGREEHLNGVPLPDVLIVRTIRTDDVFVLNFKGKVRGVLPELARKTAFLASFARCVFRKQTRHRAASSICEKEASISSTSLNCVCALSRLCFSRCVLK